MSDDFSVDDIDLAIVEQLRINGRATNQQIANNLGLTAATVSTRIRRMEDADKLRVVAVSDFSALGYNVLMELAIEVDGRPASEVAAELAELAEQLQHRVMQDFLRLVGIAEHAQRQRVDRALEQAIDLLERQHVAAGTAFDQAVRDIDGEMAAHGT